jgi:hypothetical protein
LAKEKRAFSYSISNIDSKIRATWRQLMGLSKIHSFSHMSKSKTRSGIKELTHGWSQSSRSTSRPNGKIWTRLRSIGQQGHLIWEKGSNL